MRRVLIVTIIVISVAIISVVAILKHKEAEAPPRTGEDAAVSLEAALASDPDLRALDSWVDASPNDPVARAALGSALLAKGYFANAQEHLLAAVELDSTNAAARRDLGTAYLNTGDLESAVRQWEAAVRLDPEDPAAYNNLANGYFRMNRVEEAAAVWEKAVELDPDFAPTRVNVGMAKSLLGDYEGALQELREANRLVPDLPGALYALARTFGASDRPDSAIYYLDKAVALDPRPFRQVISSSAFNKAKLDPRFLAIRQKHDLLLKNMGGGDEGEPP